MRVMPREWLGKPTEGFRHRHLEDQRTFASGGFSLHNQEVRTRALRGEWDCGERVIASLKAILLIPVLSLARARVGQLIDIAAIACLDAMRSM